MDPIYENIAANKRWTYLFFSFYGVIILLIGYAIGVYIDSPIYGLVVAFAIFATVLLVSYYRGQNIVTSISGAEEVSKSEEPYLYNVVEALSIGAGIPTPKLYMINTDVPNAFAAGRNPKNASITVTTGLMEQLDRLELEGVIAHEISHIRNHDILIATVAVVLAGTIVFIGFMARHSIYGGFRVGGRSGPAVIIFIIVFLVLIFLAPLFAKLLKLAISRKREFLADATGADLTGYPEGLASALEKISTMQKKDSKISNSALSGIYIISPAIGDDSGLFSTHPPTEERIRRLREMEFIDQKNDKTPVHNEKIEKSAFITPSNKKDVEEGYLICDKCNGYYKLQPGEKPEDFEQCQCGGKLEYHDTI